MHSYVKHVDRKDHTEIDRKTWEYPWGYAESFILSVTLLAIGFIIEFITRGQPIRLPVLPINFYIILLFAIVLIVLHWRFRETTIITWICSTPAAISAVSAYTAMLILLGFIPQHSDKSSNFLYYCGLSHIKNSWPFLLIQCYLLTSLGMVVLKRALPFKIKNVGFLLNHAGLWLTLVAAGIGSADLKRLSFNLFEQGLPTNIAISQNGMKYRMPFSLQLISFKIDQYPPNFVIIHSSTNKVNAESPVSSAFVSKGMETELARWHIKVMDYIPHAWFAHDKPMATNRTESGPAAFVVVTDKQSGDTMSGWIANTRPTIKVKGIYLNKDELLCLTQPEPQKYSSKIQIIEDSVKRDTVLLEVNKPCSVKGWELYQTGYNQDLEKLSTLSVIEAVKDPWLPIVYVGMVFLFAGSLFLFFKGKKRI